MSKDTKKAPQVAPQEDSNVAPIAPQSPTMNVSTDNDIYYLFRSDVYVDDDRKKSDNFVRAGFYKVPRKLRRFEGLSIPEVTCFTGRPDDIDIAKIAESFGIHTPAGANRDYDELLKEISRPFPY